MQGTPHKLTWREPIRFDSKQLEALCQSLGDDKTEQIISQTLTDISALMAELDRLWQHGAIDDIGAICGQVVGLSRTIGMADVTRIAGDVSACIKYGDIHGFEATFARLKRLYAQSETGNWGGEALLQT